MADPSLFISALKMREIQTNIGSKVPKRRVAQVSRLGIVTSFVWFFVQHESYFLGSPLGPLCW